MSDIKKTNDKSGVEKPANTPAAKVPPTAPERPPLFHKIDWIAFAVTSFLVFLGYFLTLAPDLTLEDCGELAVGSYYAGVPHPPGYPLWTIMTWLFTVIYPVSNIAYRVATASAVFGALSCGLLALIVSCGARMMIDGLKEFEKMELQWRRFYGLIAGLSAGILLGFNGFMWSQSVIVEVYSISVLSLTGTFALLLRWVYAPEQRKYLFWAFFMFGVCFSNHQTLIVAAMGIQVLVLATDPKLGRDLFAANSIIFVLGLFAKAKGIIGAFNDNTPLFLIYIAIGLGSLLTCLWMVVKTQKLGTEWKAVLILGIVWAIGCSFYFYMPLASMSNPPMNWGYPRTWDGFKHAFTRGQYERTNPTADPMRFFSQLWSYFEGALEEFNFIYLIIALLPLWFFRKMNKREKGWITGMIAIYLCLAVLLMVLLNPSTDRQSRELTRVFFTASHVIICVGVGYGLVLIGAMLNTQYAIYRRRAVIFGAVAAAVAIYAFTTLDKLQPIFRYAAVFGIIIAALFTVVVVLARERAPMAAILALFAVMPLYNVSFHWWDNEQRGHLFGFWFGHDMFTPPFGIYPEMSKDAVLYGGTDPGRFCPTYMIFAESFTPKEKRRDPNFDRRDVYIITQNALADNTYMNYIRAHYNRTTQIDSPFFQEMLRSSSDIERDRTNFLSRAVGPLDHYFTSLGKRIEDRRRTDGVYPKKEMYIATPDDSSRCYSEYINDAQRRLAAGQLKPGEDVRVIDNRVQVSGQVAVMAINGLLTKVMFDHNPDREFYVEESFPLDWMFPHLTPFGIIMKINRNPVPEITKEMTDKDHSFWSQYSQRLIGNFITYDTSVKDICDFAVRTYLHGDFKTFKGEPAFVRDDNGQKAFSKLRSSIAGIYTYRINLSKSGDEQQRMIKEADFAFRQAFAFCPYSPEAVFRYCNLLATLNRLDDAILVAQTCSLFDRDNPSVRGLIQNLLELKKGTAIAPTTSPAVNNFEQQYRSNPTNTQFALQLVSAYVQTHRTNQAVQVLDQMLERSDIDVQGVLSVAQMYVSLGQAARLESALVKLVALTPESPEGWYDLAAIRITLGKVPESMEALKQSLTLSRKRRAKEPAAKDLVEEVGKDPRFAPLRTQPEFKTITSPAG